MSSFWQDLRFAAKLLVKDRWFTAAAVIALALGIGLNCMIFTLVNAVLLRSLPLRNPERLVAVNMRDARNRQMGTSILDFNDYQARTRTFDALSFVFGAGFNTGDDGYAPEFFTGTYMSTNLFRFLGQDPVLGRNFTAEDDRLGAPPVVIISHGLWKRRYGADPSIIGRTVKANATVLTVIGVMPEGMQFPFNNDLWLPSSQIAPVRRTEKRDVRTYVMVGRLADGVSVAQANADLSTIAGQLAQEYPQSNKDIHPVVVPYQNWAVGDSLRTLFLSLMGAVIFVLLIACANVANLLLARAAHRSKEISVRVSLGATRWQIVRQLLVESMLLAVVSGVVGLGIALAGIRWFDAALPSGKPYWMSFTLDPLVFVFIAAVTLGTGLIFGLAPALHISKTNVNDVLKEGGRSGTAGVRARRWTSSLLVGELALTLVLLAGAGYMMRSFLALYRMDIGVDTSHLLTMYITLPARQYNSVEKRAAFLERVNERLAANPAIEAASTASSAPYGGGFPRRLEVNGRPAMPGDPLPSVTMLTVGPQYFKTINVTLLQGRAFNELDGTAGHETAVVNQRFATKHFPGDDPIGKTIRLSEDTPSAPRTEWVTIIGLVPNVRQQSFQQPGEPNDPNPDPVVYLPIRGNPNAVSNAALLVRTQGDPAGVTKVVREEFRLLDSDMPLQNVRTVDEQLSMQRWPQRVFGLIFSFFAVVALVLSSIGLYAVTAYSVTQRTQEIGVRMALGARIHQVGWLVLRRAVWQVAAGIVIGMAGAVAVGRLLRSIQFLQMGSADPTTLAPVTALLVIVSITASLWPAWRAARLNPVVALRHE